jgi:pimeloyl-ACP methyl ester carboxylesterase
MALVTPPADALKLEAPAAYAKWTEREKQHSGVGALSLVSATAWFADIPGDAILSGIGSVRAYARARGAQLSLIEDCGHYPWIEQPAVFRGALNNWFAERAGSERAV